MKKIVRFVLAVLLWFRLLVYFRFDVGFAWQASGWLVSGTKPFQSFCRGVIFGFEAEKYAEEML